MSTRANDPIPTRLARIPDFPGELARRLTDLGVGDTSALCAQVHGEHELTDLATRSQIAPTTLRSLINRADAHEAHEAGTVSVVVATRDRPELLRRALDAILAQQHPQPIEVVVVFDRSEPDTSLAMRDGDRSVVVTTNDRTPGLAGARNSGIAQARGAWIAFCDDDDQWLPGKITAQMGALRAQPDAVVATTGILVNFQGEDTARIPDPEALTFEGFLRDRMTAVHPSTILVSRRAATERIGAVDERIPGGYAEDYDWLLRAARWSRFAVAETPLVRVYWHGASFFFERWQTIDAALEYLITKFPEFHDHPVGLARLRGQQAVARAAMGDRKAAMATAIDALRRHPTERRAPVAALVALGLPAGSVLKVLHRFGKGL